MRKYCSLNEVELSYEQNFVFTDNAGQNIWQDLNKSRKIRQEH